jgi:hypothetical protein
MTGERGGTGLLAAALADVVVVVVAAAAVVVEDDGGGTGGNKADRGLSDEVQLLNPALFLLPMGAVKVELGRTRA